MASPNNCNPTMVPNLTVQNSHILQKPFFFEKEWRFHHTTSSPRFPQSNGEVECGVRTVKSLLLKESDPAKDYWRTDHTSIQVLSCPVADGKADKEPCSGVKRFRPCP